MKKLKDLKIARIVLVRRYFNGYVSEKDYFKRLLSLNRRIERIRGVSYG